MISLGSFSHGELPFWVETYYICGRPICVSLAILTSKVDLKTHFTNKELGGIDAKGLPGNVGEIQTLLKLVQLGSRQCSLGVELLRGLLIRV